MRLAALLAGALLCTDAPAQPWGLERGAARAESEPSERSDRDDDSWLPYRNYSPRTPAAEPAPVKRRESRSTPAVTETRDPDLARCDRYTLQLESLLREEMRGKNTGPQQRALHETRMREGC